MKVQIVDVPGGLLDPSKLMPHPYQFSAFAATHESKPAIVVMKLASCPCMRDDCKAVAHIPLMPEAAHAAGLLLIEAASDAGFIPTGTN